MDGTSSKSGAIRQLENRARPYYSASPVENELAGWTAGSRQVSHGTWISSAVCGHIGQTQHYLFNLSAFPKASDTRSCMAFGRLHYCDWLESYRPAGDKQGPGVHSALVLEGKKMQKHGKVLWKDPIVSASSRTNMGASRMLLLAVTIRSPFFSPGPPQRLASILITNSPSEPHFSGMGGLHRPCVAPLSE